jgi:hypothetical protein
MVVGLMCLLLVEVMFLDCFLLHGRRWFEADLRQGQGLFERKRGQPATASKSDLTSVHDAKC